MAENETTDTADTAVAEAEPNYNIRVEDAGPATKKVFVEIPKEEVAKRITSQFKELRQEAHIPGFRKGRAPAKLIEKKFASDVRDQVRRSLISESYEKAIEKNSLNVIGEPEFENAEAIKVEDDQPLNYSFSVEIQPEITLPELKGIKVKRPKITVTEDHINQAMTNLREQQGTLQPVTDRGVETKDFLTADVHVKLDGNVISAQDNASLVARPGRIAGLMIDDLDKQLAGLKPGENRELAVKVPDDYPNEQLKGKEVKIDVQLKDLKRLVPAEINQEFLDSLGFQNEQELKDALKEQMDERITFDVQNALRRQVTEHLLGQINVEIPAKLSSRQTDRIVNRRAIDLMMRGMPEERIRQNLDKLRTGAEEEGAKELKTFFILQKVAEQTGVDVTEAEMNGRIAMLALQQGERPEKLKQQMAKDGNTLSNLYVQMREEKALDEILKSAEVEDVDPTPEQQSAVSGEQKAEGESSAT